MTKKILDIAICGAGPVGQSLALLLSKRGLAPSGIVLIDAKTEQEAQDDKRKIALSYGSRQILESAGAWPVKATAIEQIHVSRKGHFGRTLIDKSEHQVPALGYVARYADILAPLTAAIQSQRAGLTFLRPARVIDIQQNESYANVLLEDQRVIAARIVVQAEGGLFGDQKSRTMHHDYQQTALVGKVKVSAPIAARAYERFTDHGPLALLPDDDGYALVWCAPPDQADRLMALSEQQFLQELQREFGERLGKFTEATPRTAYVLGLNAETSAPVGRVVRIGNAAQTLHPVAGQGLNLGLRDAVQLARSLSQANAPEALQEYYLARQADRSRTIRITDRMAQVFTIDTAGGSATQSLLGAGLGLIDIFPTAKKWIAGQMMFGAR